MKLLHLVPRIDQEAAGPSYLLKKVQPFMVKLARFPNKSLLAMAPTKALPGFIVERRKTGFANPSAPGWE